MTEAEKAIAQTRRWVADVVVGLNLCPFASRVVKQNTIRYQVIDTDDIDTALAAFEKECSVLDADDTLETTLLIFTNGFTRFEHYLDLVEEAETLIEDKDYEGIYQVASFHPDYCFAGSDDNDAANYTNRSIYPMLHLLREESIDRALQRYADPESIPQRNIQFTRNKGIAYMKMLRDACL
ncbi:MAG: DUF1415 domain-containing protein [Chitinophagales bacterium]